LEAEFLKIIEQHQGIIHKVCGLYADDAEERQDLFQEIVIQLWRAYPKFRGDAKVSTWMYRVGLNTAISYFRKVKRQPSTASLSSDLLQIADETADEEYEEKVRMLRGAIQELNKIERALVMLYLEDKNYDEISEVLGITANNARVKMNRIKHKLRTKLNVQNN